MTVSISGELSIPLKTQKGTEYGTIRISFKAETYVSFDLTAVCEINYYAFIPTGIQNFDFRITQNTGCAFEFEVDIELSYIGNDEKIVDSIYRTPADIYHLADCSQIWMYKVENLAEYTLAEAEKLYRDSWGRILNSECKHCCPFSIYLNGILFFINTSTNTVHRVICEEGDRYTVAEREIGKSLPKGNQYQMCPHCHPDKAQMLDFDTLMMNSLEYENWQKVVSEVKNVLKEFKVSPQADTGITLFRKTIPVAHIFTVTLDIDLILEFKFEGTMSYEYACDTTNVYGVRLNHQSRIEPYQEKWLLLKSNL